MTTTPIPALELRSIDKAFGRTPALSGASLLVRPGSLHMLLGENGAGKTTLLRVAAGFERPDRGTVLIDGREVRWKGPAAAMAGGVAAVQQHFSLVPAMTVAENIALAGSRLIAPYDPRRTAREVRAMSDRIGLSVDPEAVVGDLPVAGQQRVEILKALVRSPRILILDEPTSVLAPAESQVLYEWLGRFVDNGNTAIVITHHVREARQHGSAITVLRHGRTVLDVPERGESEREVVAAILGDVSVSSPLPPVAPAAVAPPRDLVLRAADVTVTDAHGTARLRGASVAIRRGEVLGVAGVDGSGYHELLQALAGRVDPASGAIERSASIAFIPEDRLRDAIIPAFTLAENFALRALGARSGTLSWSREAENAARCIADLDVRDAAPSTAAGALSGGNQQRFVIGRELADSPDSIIAENPTRGLDIKASEILLKTLRARATGGAAVVVYSSDVDDLLEIADRVVVCRAGNVTEVPVSAEAIGAAMIGAT